jgi:hypothetical protein
MVGAGVLGLPHAMSQLGWYISIQTQITPSHEIYIFSKIKLRNNNFMLLIMLSNLILIIRPNEFT